MTQSVAFQLKIVPFSMAHDLSAVTKKGRLMPSASNAFVLFHMEVPHADDMVCWNGHTHSLTHLNSFREQAETLHHPITRQRLTHAQFHNSEEFIDCDDEERATRLIAECQSRTPRREARQRHDRIVRQVEDLRSVQRRQQEARNQGRSVGRSPGTNVEQEVQRRVTQDVDAAVVLGMQQAAPDVPSPPVPAQQGQRNRNRGVQRTNRQAIGQAQENNPLNETGPLRVLPMEPWGDPEAEEALRVLLMRCRLAGHENAIHRNRAQHFNTDAASFFEEGGPVHGQVFQCVEKKQSVPMIPFQLSSCSRRWHSKSIHKRTATCPTVDGESQQ